MGGRGSGVHLKTKSVMLLKVLCALCVPAFMSLTLLAMFQSQPAFRQPLRRFSNVCACRLVFYSVIWRMAFAYISSRVLGAGELGNGSTKLQACGKFNLEISNVLLILQPPHINAYILFFFFCSSLFGNYIFYEGCPAPDSWSVNPQVQDKNGRAWPGAAPSRTPLKVALARVILPSTPQKKGGQMNILLPAHQRQPKASERFLMYGKLVPRNWPPAVQQQS